ncbi:hypothetical protein GGTG_06703 [Gaeumannomyces tritici R3-111a-1]|uniref:Uncharacterized protein n=1 Tax=Gaeumannomyces tritici (strain R3-111a-1) TaxID=644352 RepID=J3NZK5_GAET3|nr:hypothetical protein GGTG_06703 [Gaeumannomyces tritici R3-111a-1]EJT76788.1 hypothetical protein GGTG_06703 [Gaeumannomyces tritici R3-111a-1]
MQFSISALLALAAVGSAAIIDNEGVRNVGRDLIEVRSEEPEALESRQAGGNLQKFTGSLGGAPPPVTNTGGQRPFTVNGNTFNNAKAALTRSCDIQNNQCFNAVNGGRLTGGTAQCGTQMQQCIAQASVAKRQAAGGNLQKFSGSLGGAAPAVTNTGGQRPFTVNGNTFTNAKAALTRSCDIQNNQCFNAVNGGRLTGGTAQCGTQQQQCLAAAALAKRAAPRTFADNNGRTIADGGCCNHGVNLRQDICNNGAPGRCIPAASTREGCVGLTCVVNTKLTCDPTKQDRGRDLCTLTPGQ